jgi:hypothetical protein
VSNPLSSVEVPSVFEIARDQGDRNARSLYRFLNAVEEAVNDVYGQAGEAYGYTVHVDANADAAKGNGSASFPYATIGAAVAYVEASGVAGAGYVIEVAAGSYASEHVTITRPRIHLKGPQVSQAQVGYARIGRVTVNFATSAGSAPTTEATISGFVFVPASGDCLTIGGSIPCTVSVVSCLLYGESGQRAVNVTNNDARLKATRCEFQNGASALPTIAFNGNWLDMRNCNLYPGTSQAVAQAGGLVQLDSCVLQGVTGGSMVTASGTSVANYSNCYIEPTAGNSNGFVLSNTAQLTIVQNLFRVPAGSGRCVDGVLGNVVVHALNVFAPTYNNKYQTAIGAGLVPASTTPTLA